MTWDEFKTAYNFRVAEKCCENCKHGEVDWEGACNCLHPLIDDDDGWRYHSGMISSVCNLWEMKKGGAE